MLSASQTASGRNRHVAIATIVLIIIISWLGVIDRKTEEYVDGSITQALGIFGTLRLANAAISVIKSVEVDAFIASVQFGQALDPVDDLVEDASQVLKFAISSLIIQKILIEILSTEFFKLLITASGLILIASLYIKEGRFSGLLLKTFALVGLARFLFVLVIFLNGLVDQAFIDEKTTAEHNSLKGTTESVVAVGKGKQVDESDPDVIATRQRIDELNDQQELVSEGIEQAQAEVERSQANLERSETKLSETKETLGLAERYFSDNPDYEQKAAEVERREQELSDAVSVLDSHAERLEASDDELEELNAVLSGENRGFIASAKEMMDLSQIRENAELLIDSTLRLMALLTLKGIIMPVLFLVLLLKGFRYIWGIDARTVGGRGWKSLKAEFDQGR